MENNELQVEQKGETLEISLADLKEARRASMRAAVQSELQRLMVVAAGYRKNINDAKTGYKKKFYQKKMDKVSKQVMQMIVALQRLEATTAGPGPSPIYEETPAEVEANVESLSEQEIKSDETAVA